MNAKQLTKSEIAARCAQLEAQLAEMETRMLPLTERETYLEKTIDDLEDDLENAPPVDPVELADWVVDAYTRRSYTASYGPSTSPVNAAHALDDFLARLNENLRMRRPLRAPAAGAAP